MTSVPQERLNRPLITKVAKRAQGCIENIEVALVVSQSAQDAQPLIQEQLLAEAHLGENVAPETALGGLVAATEGFRSLKGSLIGATVHLSDRLPPFVAVAVPDGECLGDERLD